MVRFRSARGGSAEREVLRRVYLSTQQAHDEVEQLMCFYMDDKHVNRMHELITDAAELAERLYDKQRRRGDMT